MWPELYINSKLVSLAPSVRHHYRHYHHDEPAPAPAPASASAAAAAAAARNHLHVAGRTTPLSPGRPLPPRLSSSFGSPTRRQEEIVGVFKV